jgi:hypothetical protein
MTWLSVLVGPDDGAGARHREEHFGDIGRGPVRIKCLVMAMGMLREAVAIMPSRRADAKSS